MKYTKEKFDLIVQDYKAGKNLKDISGKYNISRSTLYSWLRNEKILTNVERKRNFMIKDYFSLDKKCLKLSTENKIYEKLLSKINLNRQQKLEIVSAFYGIYPTKTLCRLIGVDHATFYNFIKRKVQITQYKKRDEELKVMIKRCFDESGDRFGANKIYQKFKSENIPCTLSKINSLMKEMGLKSKRRNRPLKSKSDIDQPKYFYSKDLLKQNFNQESPNVFWVGDVTQMKVGANRFYICVVMDLFSRKIISYRLSSQNNNSLTINTFKDAYETRNRPVGLTFHSDQGSNYTSFEYSSLLHSLKVKQSLSKKGTPYDNSVIESFFCNMKRDDLYSREYEYFEDLEEAVKNYIDFYNNFRPHKSLKYKTPNEIERNVQIICNK